MIVDKIINLHAERSRRAKGRDEADEDRLRRFLPPDPEVNGFPCTPLSNAVGFFDLSRRTADFYPFLSSVEEGAVCDRTNLFARVFDSGHIRPARSFLPDRLAPRSGFLPASFGRARAARRMRAVLKRSTNGVNARISKDQIELSAPFRNAPRLLRPFNACFS